MMVVLIQEAAVTIASPGKIFKNINICPFWKTSYLPKPTTFMGHFAVFNFEKLKMAWNASLAP
jgi:hypothetical protein